MAKTARKTAGSADVELAVIEAAMQLAVDRGWRRVALADIAAAANLPLPELYDRFSSKAAILGALSRRADLAAAGGDPLEDSAERPRDRLFDVVMRRLDHLRPWRQGLAAITRDLRGDPMTGLAALPAFRRSLDWMLEAAGFDTAGVAGIARRKAFGAIYVATVATWLKDDSPDLTATMARLDRALRRIDGWTSLFGGDPSQPRADAAMQ